MKARFNDLAKDPTNPLPLYNLYCNDDGVSRIYWWNIYDANCNYDKMGKIQWREDD